MNDEVIEMSDALRALQRNAHLNLFPHVRLERDGRARSQLRSTTNVDPVLDFHPAERQARKSTAK
jgi:hypothetical protein